MSGMAASPAPNELWNWCIAGHVQATPVRDALSAVLGRPVASLGTPGGEGGATLCDVWQVGGDFPTLVDCYLAPSGYDEATVASAVAVRLGRDCLLPDDTLNPSRYLLAEPDGTLRPVHVEEVETDDGTQRWNPRPCTGADPSCVAPPGCTSSRWPPARTDPRGTDRDGPGGRAANAG